MSARADARRQEYSPHDRKQALAETVYRDVRQRLHDLDAQLGTGQAVKSTSAIEFRQDIRRSLQQWPELGDHDERDSYEGWLTPVRGNARQAYSDWASTLSQLRRRVTAGHSARYATQVKHLSGQVSELLTGYRRSNMRLTVVCGR